MAYSLLIADDEREIRHGLVTYFPWKATGFEVVAEAEDGDAALLLLTTRHIDVALLDIRMPGKTGLEVARALQEKKSATTVVMLSAYRDFEYARQAMSYGVQHYVLKSTRYQEMIGVFERLKRSLDERLQPEQAEVRPYYDALQQGITEYLGNHPDSATLEGAAAAVGKSASFVSKTYRDTENRQFGEALLSLRMQRAAKLLRDYRLKTYQVSESVGYATPKSFTRAFRQYFGKSPQEYRRETAREEPEA